MAPPGRPKTSRMPSFSSDRTTAWAPVIVSGAAGLAAAGVGTVVESVDMRIPVLMRVRAGASETQPVVAPSEAERTSLEYFARTPRV
ncbi:hypothetical protein ARHIZOSPH14_27920 [Agromyces rhizosphaerae]|uniref:Uncharacterized protein n=1 Tax=Agromyces rhizosphaerae TaxID=88374 RepID=A0A9W6CZN0_9MICO|nr:hypothetical protein ARHIZOSPH14_27920 [Agromyces rhizosphaerae]